ncbi:SDR family NAD(P)-dependent oxidoreductase [Paraburkholderia tropica]|uniref:SDR family NAD(P)-dependent oxidoreductase n=1 Tax=Paraburkholderia tropica TaxID=92647 RepID=UPI002AB742B6|nr:SDR family oxidoreductase [Paraburkholderia tropica]
MDQSLVASAASRANEQHLNGHIAVVTGGSSGIGAACVRLLAAHGARVVIGYNRGEARAEELRASLPGEGHRCAHIPLERDEASDAALSALTAELAKEGGKVDVLVNSAGFTQRIAHSDLDSLTPELFDRILSANATGTYSVIRAFMPLLRESRDAVVINISSVSAFTGLGSNIAYCAAKAATDTMTQSFARAFGDGIRFLSVSPASVDTDFVAGRNREELQSKAEKTPLGRIVTPEDVASSVLACITHLRTATGARIVIDGGHTL